MTQAQLNLLNQLFEDAKYEEFIQEVQGIEIDKSFLPKLALSHFHTENYSQSTELFEKICEESNDPVDWFNLSTSSILNGDERKGLEALHKAIKNNTETETNGKGMPTPFMLLYATKALVDASKFNQAYNQLNELANIYTTLSITDDHFLYSRGVPFFNEFVELAKTVLPKQQVTDSKQWIAYISSQLDEVGKEQMQQLEQMV